MLEIDVKSIASQHLVLYAFSEAVSTGTGFIVNVEGVNLLITNYHVLSGRHPQTGHQLESCFAIPDRVLIPVLRNDTPNLSWYPIVQMLISFGKNTWLEHPEFGHSFDVVALPIQIPSNCIAPAYDISEQPDIALHLGSNVSIVGFPEGMSGSGITAIWKTGAIASEPELDIEENNFFWIDANTRRGMSGSPVIARRFGTVQMRDGSNVVTQGTVDRILGVYAGRALEAPDMTLGRVWKWEEVKKLIKSAVSKVQKGILYPHSCNIGYFYEQERNMVKIDILKSVKLPVKDPTGKVITNNVTVANIIQEFVLSDGRFGQNLERVKIAAKIGAALDQALNDKTMLEVEEADYAIMREAVETPTNSYNPAVARLILPLLQSILDAGKVDDEN